MYRKGKHILLVEDEALIAMSTAQQLRNYEYQVSTVSTGEKAVELVNSDSSIELILMDIDLGTGIDGTEAAKIILKEKNLPVVFLSSHTEREIVEKTEKITSYGYVVKQSGIVVLDASMQMAFRLYNANIEINNRNKLIEEGNVNLQATLDGLLVGVVVHDADTNIILSNPEASSLLGLTAEQLSGKDAADPAWKFVYEDSTPMKLEDYPVNRVIAAKKPIMNYVLGIIRPDKDDITWINVNAKPLFNSDNNLEKIIVNFVDITEQKLTEKKLQESEVKTRNKLKAITESEGNIDSLELSDIIDTEVLQNLLEDFYELTGMLCAVLDLSGKILVAVGWQDICTKFHRCNPETLKNCVESDTILTQGVPQGTFKAYHCKNNLWDIVTPLYIGGRHIGNIFMGQYFLDGEEPDVELFRAQAVKYGFDEEEYLAALEKVPRFSREMVDTAMRFYSKLAGIISTLSYSTISQSRLLNERNKANADLQKKQYYLSKAQEMGKIGTWELDLQKNTLEWTEENYKIFGVPVGTKLSYEHFLDCIHPDDRQYVIEKWNAGLNKQPYDIVHRVVAAGEVKWVREKAEIEFDKSGSPVKAIGFTQDVTDRKNMEDEIRFQLEEKELILKEIHHRIKNNFASMVSLLNLQTESITNPEAISALKDTIGRLNSYKVLYEKMLLTGNYKTSSSKTYLENLMVDFMQLFPHNIDISIESIIDDFHVDTKKLILIGFIVNEILTNTVKHAFKGMDSGSIKLMLKEDNGNIILMVRDNGNGLPDGINLNESDGFGIKLIEIFVQQLEGKVSIKNESGLKFEITFRL